MSRNSFFYKRDIITLDQKYICNTFNSEFVIPPVNNNCWNSKMLSSQLNGLKPSDGKA